MDQYDRHRNRPVQRPETRTEYRRSSVSSRRPEDRPSDRRSYEPSRRAGERSSYTAQYRTQDEAERRRRAAAARRRRKKRQQQKIMLAALLVVVILVIVIIVSCSRAKNKEEVLPEEQQSVSETMDNSVSETDQTAEFTATGTGIGSEVYSGFLTALNDMENLYTKEAPKELQITHENWETLLVNHTHKVPDGYSSNTKEVHPTANENSREFDAMVVVDTRIVEPLEDMLIAMKEAGLSPVVLSGYRNSSYQDTLVEENIAECLNSGMTLEEAKAQTEIAIAKPGCSEHNAGLSVDISTEDIMTLDEELMGTPEMQWLQEHCAEYGFILRYPVEKSEQTDIIYEPWHFRYIGKDLARKITDSGLCLEEYYEQHPEMRAVEG